MVILVGRRFVLRMMSCLGLKSLKRWSTFVAIFAVYFFLSSATPTKVRTPSSYKGSLCLSMGGDKMEIEEFGPHEWRNHSRFRRWCVCQSRDSMVSDDD